MPVSAGKASPKRIGRVTRTAVLGVAALVCAAPARADAPPPASPSASPSPPTQERHVDIDAYDVDGNTKLDQDTVEAAVYPYLGPQRTRQDVACRAQALQKAYQSRGYQSVVVEIPAQTVSDGIRQIACRRGAGRPAQGDGQPLLLPSDCIKEQETASARKERARLQPDPRSRYPHSIALTDRGVYATS